jgi:hypothetical protein
MASRPTAKALRALLALAVLAAASCADSVAPVPVVVLSAQIRAGRGASADSSGLHFARGSGEAIALHRARVTVSSIELFPCPTAAERILELLSPVGAARAHGVSTERRMAVPRVLDLVASEGRSVELGRLLPPMGNYCYARVVFGPTDADGASESGIPEMAGLTLDIGGEVEVSDSKREPFALSSAAMGGIELDLDPLVVKAGADLSFDFRVNYGAWLDGVDLKAADAGEQAVAQAVRSLSR